MIIIIVGDLPYGVFHGSSAGKRNNGRYHNPTLLLEEDLTYWYADDPTLEHLVNISITRNLLVAFRPQK